MGLNPIAFVRAFPMRRETLCSEPVLAWAHYRGHRPVSRREQYRLWKSAGSAVGAAIVAKRMGLSEVAPADAGLGDAALFAMENGEAVLGLHGGEFSVIASFGKIHIGRFSAMRVWRI